MMPRSTLARWRGILAETSWPILIARARHIAPGSLRAVCAKVFVVLAAAARFLLRFALRMLSLSDDDRKNL
jgi:hypothetical protein